MIIKKIYSSILIIIVILFMLLFVSCGNQDNFIISNDTSNINNLSGENNSDNNYNNNNDLVNENGSLNGVEGNLNNSVILDQNSKLEDFYGKPSIIVFGSTTCPHCVNAIPVFETQIYEEYKDQINVWVNVVNNGKFNVKSIPQGLNRNLNFDQITNKKCGYVPSWIILNKDGSVMSSSCGNEKSLEDMLITIRSMIN